MQGNHFTSEYMNKEEANSILSQIVSEFQQKEYSFWEKALADSPLVITRNGLSGTEYQIEADVVWDDCNSRRIRVLVSIDDGRFFSALKPMTESFLIEPATIGMNKTNK
jgi:hypothetical protein